MMQVKVVNRTTGSSLGKLVFDSNGWATLTDENGNILTLNNCLALIFIRPYTDYVMFDKWIWNDLGYLRVRAENPNSGTVLTNLDYQATYGYIPK